MPLHEAYSLVGVDIGTIAGLVRFANPMAQQGVEGLPVVEEAGIGRTEMPFPDVGCGISGIVEQIGKVIPEPKTWITKRVGDRLLVVGVNRGGRDRIDVATQTMRVRIAAGENGRPSWATQGLWSETISKSDAPPCQGVQVRGVDFLFSIAANGISAALVKEDEKDVWGPSQRLYVPRILEAHSASSRMQVTPSKR